MMNRIYCLIILSLLVFGNIQGQECNVTIGGLYGNTPGNEVGNSIAATPENDGVYVAGERNDSILLLRLDLNGAVVWSRIIDVVPNEPELPVSLIVDSDGMLAISGLARALMPGETIFAFRYNPNTHTIIWSNEYSTAACSYTNNIVQKGPGGNYFMSNNPHCLPDDDAEILELDLNTGQVVLTFAKNYQLEDSESITIEYDGNFIYGVGRYTSCDENSCMRNTIVKIDPNTGSHVWAKMGHIGPDDDARLYGVQLVIDGDNLYSGYWGDPAGTSTTNTKMYLQKTSTDGELIWVYQYELPGNTDSFLSLVKSGNGYVVLAGKDSSNDGLILFKVDFDGNVLWSRRMIFDNSITGVVTDRTYKKMVVTGNQIFFTAGAVTNSGTDMLIVRTDLEGRTSFPCIQSEDIEIDRNGIENPQFYSVTPVELNMTPEVTPTNTTVNEITMGGIQQCLVIDTIYSSFDTTICQGTTFEGYSMTGQYNDVFQTSEGCDSIRTLNLTVLVCQPECGGNSGGIYGSPNSDEQGTAVVATAENDGYFLLGTKNDSILLVRFNLAGQVIWSRAFDFVPGERETASSILLDSEGMLAAVAGAGNTPGATSVFAFRYNPNNHQLLWIKRYNNSEVDVPASIIQKGAGGNYIFTNNLDYPIAIHSDLQVIELDKNTGNRVFAKVYTLGGTEGLNQMVYDGNFLYGTGRYKDGGTVAEMRNTITKLDPTNGNEIWTRLGHKPANQAARLYGCYLVVDEEKIISIYSGDPAGTSVTNTKVFIQRTTLDGELVWLKQYEIPGANDITLALIKSGNDYLALLGQASNPDKHYLMKINEDGDVLWAKTYNFSSNLEGFSGNFGNLRMIQVANQIIFTGIVNNLTGDNDILVMRTDLDGNVNTPCITSEIVTIPVVDVPNPVFYSVNTTETVSNIEATTLEASPNITLIEPAAACFSADTVFTFIDTTICRGQSIEGYTTTGEHIDIFEAANGCDSIRTINLTVLVCDPIIHWGLEACESYMINGSHMIFTEFVADYPTILTCADVEADHVDMEPSPMSKHSCTPGVNGTVAMCIGASPSCTYNPGDVTSLIFSFTVDVPQDSSVQVTGFEFFEKAPTTYNWIDGPSGPNNYPRFYGIRILKNGTEIFQQSGIATTGNWTLQRFDFLTDSLFRVEEDTDFRIELLPYCPVGNGAEVSAWDIDEIRVFGGCIPFITFPIIGGDVATRNGKLIPNTYLHLADNHTFDLITTTNTDADGRYVFDDLRLHTSYYVKGYNNGNVLQGVSTLDLIMMQRHLLGIQPLSTLHQYIAADINHNGAVSIIDIVELRKMLLGIYTGFPKNTSWRFGVLPQDFTGTDISTFTEVSSIEAIQDGITIINFEGIKIGDVNEDIKLNLHGEPIIIRNADQITFRIDDAPVHKGDAFTMEVTSENIDELLGFQLALMCRDLSLVSVDGAALPVSEENISFTNDGLLRMTWHHDRSYPVRENEVLFTLTFTASTAGMISDKISVNQSGLQPEAYTGSDLKSHELNIEFERPAQKSEINSLRIEPNPLTTQAAVKFTLSTGGEAVINFFDLSGKLVYSIQKEYAAGDHTEHINAKDLLSGDGVIYCQLVCNGYTSMQKLVLLK